MSSTTGTAWPWWRARTAGADAGPARLIRYQLADHLDSSVLELDQHAQVISYEQYYPYGSHVLPGRACQYRHSKAIPVHGQGT